MAPLPLRTAGLLLLLSLLPPFGLPGAPALAQSAASAPEATWAPEAAPTRPSPAALRAALLYGPAGPSPHAFHTNLLKFSETDTTRPVLKDRPDDPWLAFDKVQHVTFCFLWTLGSQYTLVNKGSLREAHALPVSIGISALIGVSKELYDWKAGPTRYFSKRDLVADAVGIALATGLILL